MALNLHHSGLLIIVKIERHGLIGLADATCTLTVNGMTAITKKRTSGHAIHCMCTRGPLFAFSSPVPVIIGL